MTAMKIEAGIPFPRRRRPHEDLVRSGPEREVEVSADLLRRLEARGHVEPVSRVTGERSRGRIPIWMLRAMARSRSIASRTALLQALALRSERTRALTSRSSNGLER